MKIFIISEDDPFFRPSYFEKIISANERDVLGIALFQPKEDGIIKVIKKYFGLFGFIDFIKISSLYFSLKFMDKIKIFYHNKKVYSIHAIAKRYNVPFYKIRNLDENSLKILRKHKPDIIIAAVNKKISKEFLDIPRLGWIFQHASLLPKYRGILPIFWAMLNNETQIGVSILKMNEQVDRGEILEQCKIPILQEDTLFSLYKKCFDKGSELMIKVIDRIRSDSIKIIDKTKGKTSYYSFPTKSHIIEFKKKGKKLI